MYARQDVDGGSIDSHFVFYVDARTPMCLDLSLAKNCLEQFQEKCCGDLFASRFNGDLESPTFCWQKLEPMTRDLAQPPVLLCNLIVRPGD